MEPEAATLRVPGSVIDQNHNGLSFRHIIHHIKSAAKPIPNANHRALVNHSAGQSSTGSRRLMMPIW